MLAQNSKIGLVIMKNDFIGSSSLRNDQNICTKYGVMCDRVLVGVIRLAGSKSLLSIHNISYRQLYRLDHNENLDWYEIVHE